MLIQSIIQILSVLLTSPCILTRLLTPRIATVLLPLPSYQLLLPATPAPKSLGFHRTSPLAMKPNILEIQKNELKEPKTTKK